LTLIDYRRNLLLLCGMASFATAQTLSHQLSGVTGAATSPADDGSTSMKSIGTTVFRGTFRLLTTNSRQQTSAEVRMGMDVDSVDTTETKHTCWT
jgi:hypothetical protein